MTLEEIYGWPHLRILLLFTIPATAMMMMMLFAMFAPKN